MPEVTIYHNPRCSKSRQTLAILEENNVAADVVLYLENPPTSDELKTVLKKLDIPARQLLRKGEEAYKVNKLADEALSDDELVAAMVKDPILIERPIVITAQSARIGRPPEQVLEILS